MEGQEINLKWKSFHSSIVTGFERLWEEEGLVDVTLTSDGRCVKAHKVVLSASSPLFKEILLMNPCQHPVIVLQDVHYNELMSILTFVYKGEVNILQENLPTLLRAAETLQIHGLYGQEESKSNIFEEDDVNAEVSSSPPPPVEVVLSSPKSPPAKKRRSSASQETINHKKPTALLDNENVVQNLSKNTKIDDNPSKVSEGFGESPFTRIRRSPTPMPPVTAAVFPIPHELVNEIDRPGSPAISEVSGDEPVGSSEPHGSEVEGNNYAYPPFPCPFCDRAYTRWGFRRRHIKSCHTKTKRLPCKWCFEVLPSGPDWEKHVCLKHSLPRVDARNGLLILEEAEVVLQISQPTKLEALVTMIKDIDDAEVKDESMQDEHVLW